MIPRLLIATLAMLFNAAPVWSHEGHDHDDAPPPIETGWTPRATARSDDFDLVAAMEGGQMRIWLDRGSDNAPVADARIDVEAGAWKGEARPAGDGSYRVDAADLARPGEHALVFTVQAGTAVDLLPATLVLKAEPVANSPDGRGALLPMAVGGVVAIVGLGMWWRRRRAAA